MENSEQQKGIDYIGVNCVFYCHDGNGRVLLHKRSQKCRDERGVWDSGAGSMEFGETFEETVRREVLEEYGTNAIKVEYVGTKNVLRQHEGRTTHWIKNLHWVQVNPKNVRIGEPDKMDEIGWFSLDSPPSPLHSQWDDEVQMLKKFYGAK